MHVDAMELTCTMAFVMTEKDKNKYKRLGDVIEHVKKCGAYNFYGTLNPSQADKWIKIVEKAFTILQLSDEEKISNYYKLMFDKVDDWLTRV